MPPGHLHWRPPVKDTGQHAGHVYTAQLPLASPREAVNGRCIVLRYLYLVALVVAIT